MACPQLYKYTYVDGWERRRPGGARLLGQAVHAGLAAHYSGGNAEGAAEGVLRAAGSALYSDKAEANKATVAGMLRGYKKRYPTEDFKVTAVEQKFEFRLRADTVFEGTIDALIRRDGKLWVMEHKTSARVDRNYLDRTQIDWQILGYMCGAFQRYGEVPAGVLYNVIQKPALRRRMAESEADYRDRIVIDYEARPEFYFAREEILVGGRQLGTFLKELAHVTKIIDMTQKVGGVAWYQNTTSCNRYNRCDFLDACCNGRRVSEAEFERIPDPTSYGRERAVHEAPNGGLPDVRDLEGLSGVPEREACAVRERAAGTDLQPGSDGEGAEGEVR